MLEEMKLRLTQPSLVELGLGLSLAIKPHLIPTADTHCVSHWPVREDKSIHTHSTPVADTHHVTLSVGYKK